MKKLLSLALSVLMLANICIGAVHMNAGAADADITIEAQADAQVQGGSGADRNYGASTSIQVRDDGYRKSIFRFDLSDVQEEISKAVFRVYCNTAAKWEFPLVVGLSEYDDWIEGSKKGTAAGSGELTYNSFPQMEASFDYPFVPQKGYMEIDVTDYVQKKLSDGTVSIILSGSSASSADRNPSFLTRENSVNKPQLVLTTSYEPVAQSVELTGETQIITEGSGTTYADYTARVLDQTGNAFEAELEWSVFKKDTENKPDGISISDGRLEIGEQSGECEVDIFARLADNPEIYAKLSVTIIPGGSLRQITLGAEADTFVQGGSLAAYNFGVSPSIQIRDDSYRRGILRFNTAAIPSEAKKAVLRLYCATDGTAVMPMHIGVADDNDWIEGTKNSAAADADELCNGNMPDYTELISYPFVPKKGYIEIDVTELVRTAGDKLSLVLTGEASANGSVNVYFNSREAASGGPELIVLAQYEPKPASIDISGEKQVISPSETQFTATVYDQASQLVDGADLKWRVTENGEEVGGITIENGLLKVGEIKENHEVDVTVYCADDEAVCDSMRVKVIYGGAYITRKVSVTTEADAQLQGGSKTNTNYGASKSIMIRNDGYRRAIFRFDMTDVYGIVESAELSVYKSATTNEELPFVLGLAASDDWVEGDKADMDAVGGEICESNAPATVDKLPVTMSTASGYVSFNVKPFVERKLVENKKASIYITGETNGGITNVSFYAKEAGINAARLDLVMKYMPELSHIDISGDNTIIVPYAGTQMQSYTASFSDQYYEPISAQQPTWSIIGDISGVEVDENGIITVSDSAQSGKIKLAAESEGKCGELDITVLTAEEAVEAAYNTLDLGDLSYVTDDIALPTNGEYNTAISWSSSDENIIAPDGKVNRPETDFQTTDVELTAVISAGGVTKNKTFTASVVKKPRVIELSPERKGFIHMGGAARERLINPYQTWITAGGNRKTVLKFDISELRKHADKIERAEVMVVPWFQQAQTLKTDLINSAVISDDWDPFALADDGLYEIDGVNYAEHVKILRDNVAAGKNTYYNQHKYISLDMTEQVKAKIADYSAQNPTTVNKGAVSGNKFSVMLYADDVEFVSTQQYYYPIMVVTMAYDSEPCDIEIEQDIYYDEKVRVPASGVEWRQYVASAEDELGNKYDSVDDFKFTLAEDYQGVTISESGRLEADATAQEGIVTVVCRSESCGLEKSFDVEILPPIGEVERPNLLFDKDTIAQFRQNVYSDTALLNKYKTMRETAASVDLDELSSVEYIRDNASPWVNSISTPFTAPSEAVKMEFGFKAYGQGDWEFDSTSVMWVGKSYIEYDNADFEDGAGDTPNGWHREIISGSPELRWDNKENSRQNPIRSGARSIGLTGYSEEDCGAWVTEQIDCVGGERYIFYTAYYQKDFSPDGGVVMFARFYDKDGNCLDEYYQESGELNYRTISRRNGLSYGDFTAAFAMEGTENFAYGAKQYLKYHLYECKWRIENGDDSTQAVHLGRIIQGYALAYDLLRGYGYISEEEDREMRSYFYWLTDKLMDQNFYRRDNAQDLSHNYNADRTSGVLSVAACFPDWSKSEEYIDDCIENIHYIFGGGGVSFGKNGEWLETLRYQDAVANQLFGAFEILKRTRGIDMFEDENIKKFCLYPALVQTPRDAANATYPNFAGSPQIGNSLFSEGSMVLGRAAKVYRDIDPELSAELAYAWKRAGSAVSAYHPLVLLNSYDSGLPEKKISLSSRYFDNGYITFRENYGIDGRENYFVLVGSDTGYGSHQDPDRGSFSMWANSTCIAQDPGVANYDGNSAWFRDSGAHNMVTFYETDTSDTTINGVDTTVDEVHFSEELDYARIIADDTKNTYQYKRNVAFVKNGFSAYVIWDDIENSSRRSRFNLHTISTSSDVNGNKITGNCYNNMVLDTVVLNEDTLDVEIEWGRMSGGYPTVLTDFSSEPVEVAEHIKITNPKNQDFVTLLYPRKSSDSGLITETLDTGSGADAYKISKSSGEYFVVVINNTNQTAQVTLPEAMRDAKSGESVGQNAAVEAAGMKILFPKTLAPITPVSLSIEGVNTISIPACGMETGYFTADVFDNYNNTMPERQLLWSISGDTQGVSVSESGAVYVEPEATAGGTVTLTAAVVGNEEVTGSITITLAEDTELAGVEISGPVSVSAPSNTSYSAVFTDKYGRTLEGYRAVWSLQSIIDGVTLGADGTLRVASSVPNGTRIELAVSYAADLTINSRLVVTVGDAALTSAVINGADTVGIPGSAKYTVVGKDQNGSDCGLGNATVSFSIAEHAEGVSITQDGVLTVSENAQPDAAVVIEAAVGESIKAQKEITLKDSVPAKIVITGKTSVYIPSKGILSEKYTATVYDQKDRVMSGEKAELTMNSAQGVSFSGDTLCVTQYASAQKLTITAACGGITEQLIVELKVEVNSGSGNSGSAGGSVSSGGYVNDSSVPVAVNTKTGFVDLSGYDWAKEAVEYLHEKGMISGISETEFAPGADITRAEFVTMLVNTFGLEEKEPAPAFNDVDSGDWYFKTVSVARSLGIAAGNENNDFEPQRNITRQEMAAIVYRTLDMLGRIDAVEDVGEAFADDAEISDWAAQAVGYMRASGVITGVGDNYFKPLDNAARAQAAVIMYKIILQ